MNEPLKLRLNEPVRLTAVIQLSNRGGVRSGLWLVTSVQADGSVTLAKVSSK